MPAVGFLCNGQNIAFDTCLNECPFSDQFPGGRCLSKRTLRFIAEQREWAGTPSTTQLLKGTREAVFEIIYPYYIDPQKAIFRIIGTKGHGLLDQYVGSNELGEIRIKDEISSGAFDFYDPETGDFYDTKTSGSYKIRKAMGLYQVDVPTGEVYKTGEKKGKPKTKKEWREGGYMDCLDWKIQLNDYRLKLESCGFPVKRMFVEALARDSGLKAAAMNGVEQNGTLIPIGNIPDRHIKAYMQRKKDLLIGTMEVNSTPPKCRTRETWNGRKCQGYCNVSEYCQIAEEVAQ
ncbi:MAG: hypothetical protein P4L49_02755 [Desulfosporosinus sp.]|nr:hypothetical protein [Desulfosporosinus sp.]